MGQPLLLTTKGAAELLGIHRLSFPALARTEGLTAVSTGRRRYWKRAEVLHLAGLSTEKGYADEH